MANRIVKPAMTPTNSVPDCAREERDCARDDAADVKREEQRDEFLSDIDPGDCPF
jgi:hypothetical protein